MKEFLIENYSWIITLIFSIASILIFLLKKVKIVKKDNFFEKVLELLPSLIVKAEASGKSGCQKKDYVLWSAMGYLHNLLDHEMTMNEIDLYTNKISEAIEAILSTPVKKEVKDENKK